MTRFYALLAATLCALTVFVAVASSNYHAPTTHDHGAPVPDWVTQYDIAHDGTGLVYGGDESTPNEDQLKHPAFKGYALRLLAINGTYVDVYARVHEASNAPDREKRFHSAEIYMRDATGGISKFQGWLDRGDPATQRFPANSPMVLDTTHADPLRGTPHGWVGVVTPASWSAGYRMETWYTRNADWAPDIVTQILDPTTFYVPGEKFDDPVSAWHTTGLQGVKRRIFLYWYGKDSVRYPTRNNDGPVGAFCSDVYWNIEDCSTPGSLSQFIAPTLPSIEQAVGTYRVYACPKCVVGN